ncbi:UNVERIFIED_CONTAM: hypothetical protein ACS92_02550 [Bacillus cereus]
MRVKLGTLSKTTYNAHYNRYGSAEPLKLWIENDFPGNGENLLKANKTKKNLSLVKKVIVPIYILF